jgi:tetratricopeptide (TPR) repeat protein
MTRSPDLLDTDPSLEIRARQAWREIRDAQGEGARLADGLVGEARQRGDVAALVTALRARGWAEREGFALREARATLNEAVRLARRDGLVDLLPDVLATRASVRLELGRVGDARRDIAEARAVLAGRPSPEVDAQAAIIEDAVGSIVQAAGLYRAAIDAGADAIPPETAFTLHNNLGVVLAQLGDLDGSREALSTAEAIASELGRNKQGYALHNHALTSLLAGDVPDALRRFDAAERIFLEVELPLAEHYMERMDAFMTLRLLDEAVEVADRAVGQLEQARHALLLGEARLRRARARLAAGDLEGAHDDALRAAGELARHRGPAWAAQARLVVLEARADSGKVRPADLAAARASAGTLEAAGFLNESIQARLVASRLAIALGRPGDGRAELAEVRRLARGGPGLLQVTLARATAATARIDGDDSAARRAAQRGLDALARFRAALPTTELRALAAGHGAELAAVGLAATLASGRADHVLGWMEQVRVASVLQEPPRTHDPELAEVFAQLRAVIARQRAGQQDAHDDPARLRAEQARLERRIQRRQRTIDPSGTASTRAASPREIRAALGGRALIEFADLEGELVAVAVARGEVTVHRLGPSEPALVELAALLFGLRRVMRARSAVAFHAVTSGIEHSLRRLDRLVVEPLAAVLGTADPVVIVPPASLAAVPWHALEGLTSRSVTVAPSATLWLRAYRAPAARAGVVVIAGPGLVHADQEAEAVSRVHPGSRALVSSAATVTGVLDALAGTELAHLACHGTFRGDNPSFSSLELHDGPLTLLDLETLGTAPAVVVLAACDAGMSEVLPGDELIGLVTALFALGTRAIVASVVAVPDAESESLMVALHGRLARGVPIGRALTEARATLDTSTPSGLVAALAFGCFGAGEVTVGGRS